jgi:dihydroorotate dehydrogenase (fumarate)
MLLIKWFRLFSLFLFFAFPLFRCKTTGGLRSGWHSAIQPVFQPDIDLKTLEVLPKLELSSLSEALLSIRWTALLYGRTKLSLAVTGGFHQTRDVVKALLAETGVVHLCSVLLEQDVGHLTQNLTELEQWLIEHEYKSIN